MAQTKRISYEWTKYQTGLDKKHPFSRMTKKLTFRLLVGEVIFCCVLLLFRLNNRSCLYQKTTMQNTAAVPIIAELLGRMDFPSLPTSIKVSQARGQKTAQNKTATVYIRYITPFSIYQSIWIHQNEGNGILLSFLWFKLKKTRLSSTETQIPKKLYIAL